MWMTQCSLLTLLTWVTVIQGKCSISMKDGLPKIEPLILRPGVAAEFRYPTKNGILGFSTNEKVRLVCNGPNNYFVNLGTNPKKTDVIAVCDNNGEFKVTGFQKSKPFSELGCKNWPATEQKTVGSCLGSNNKYDIGFVLDKKFIKLIEVCHDPKKIITLYTKFELAKEIEGGRTGQPSPPFQECPDHDICYNDQYLRRSQIATFGRILGSVDEAKKYIQEEGTGYLSRGHLAANADFIYNFQKRATYYYINQAPQWQRCNGDTWSNLEKTIRKFASDSKQDLTVYTGVHGLIQLSDKKNVKQDLYLNFVNANEKSIPVPRFFWKVIYNEKTQLGTAFVEVNNPYFDEIHSNYKIAEKLLQNAKWNSWRRCFSYVCEVDQLRKFVNFPTFTVKGPLIV